MLCDLRCDEVIDATQFALVAQNKSSDKEDVFIPCQSQSACLVILRAWVRDPARAWYDILNV